jgi:hypothetical protein
MRSDFASDELLCSYRHRHASQICRLLKSRQVDSIFALGSADGAMGWVAACNVEAKWNGQVYQSASDDKRGTEFEEYARGVSKGDELTIALYKGIWHALEPGKGFMSTEASSWA